MCGSQVPYRGVSGPLAVTSLHVDGGPGHIVDCVPTADGWLAGILAMLAFWDGSFLGFVASA